MNDKKVISQLNIKSDLNKIFAICWWVIGGIAFILMHKKDKSTHFTYYTFMGTRYRERYEVAEWDANYKHLEYTGEFKTRYFGGVALIIIAAAVIILTPIVISAINSFIAKRCKLTLEEDQIVGTLRMPLSTKQIQMPIEKLDNVFTSKSILDMIRGGETVSIHSNSGVVKFPFVQNAGEFAAAAVAQIERYKRTVNAAAPVHPAPAPAPVPQAQQSVADQLTELKKLLDAGIISAEDFEKKKSQLLGL